MFNSVYKNKKVLVTGHTGFKGTWLTLWLQNLGADVTGYALAPYTDRSLFEQTELATSIHHYIGDIRDSETFSKLFDELKPDFVFHLAAQAIVSESIADPLTTYTTNVIGTLNVLEAIRKAKHFVTAVIITSDKCYENVEWEYGYREVDKLGGKDPYSASKAGAELVFSSHFRTYLSSLPNIKIASARAGNVIGGGDWSRDRIVPDMMMAWGSNELSKVRSPNATRPWQHVLEPLSGYLRIGQLLAEGMDEINGESFNIGPTSEVDLTVIELVRRMIAIWDGKDFELVPSKLNQKEASLLKLCCDKAQRSLKWKPTLDLDETLEFTVGWYKNFFGSNASKFRDFTLSQIYAYESKANERNRSFASRV
ncbi:MAG: CDP-glucose 4,6-dehydratase [Proteobacteria bacterium]|nr:MAG: CDP-glucose 4,6-dehydratase [Pseudomonadota bacterium]